MKQKHSQFELSTIFLFLSKDIVYHYRTHLEDIVFKVTSKKVQANVEFDESD